MTCVKIKFQEATAQNLVKMAKYQKGNAVRSYYWCVECKAFHVTKAKPKKAGTLRRW